MNIPKFWSKELIEQRAPDGQMLKVTARGWSTNSLQEAVQMARNRAQRIVDMLSRGIPEDRKSYLYGERPIPEPILKELSGRDGEAGAVVTRNGYGCLVLNTQQMMFVDIDLEPTSGGGFLSKLFGGKSKPENGLFTPAEEQALAPARELCASRGDLGMRIYRTKAGLRLIITGVEFDPKSPEADALLRRLGADDLYRRLCKQQESFRARLTPKPWRCGADQPPVRFPFKDSAEEAEFVNWETAYNAKISQFATCKLLTSIGHSSTNDLFDSLIELHDRTTKTSSDLPLA